LTFAPVLAILQAMRDGILIVGALRAALSARRDLLLEYLALRPSALARIDPGSLARSGPP